MQLTDVYGAYFPERIRFGNGVRREVPLLADELGGGTSKIFWVVSGSVLKGEPASELKELLGERIVDIYTGVPHDPPVECVDDVIARLKASGATVVVATGGGSVMDTAKTASLLCFGTCPTREYLSGYASLPTQRLPVIAMPSTAGTGAEITKNTVLSDHQANVKKSLRSPLLVPKAAVVDPELTLGLPFAVTRDSGLDALTQAIESCTSTGANRMTRALAREAVLLLMGHLEQACENGMDVEERVRVAEGSLLGGLAFGQSGLGAVHGLAHPLGHVLSVSHGLACAILLPYILQWNLPVAADEYATLGRMAGFDSGEAFVQGVTALCRRLDVPCGFKAFGLLKEHFDYVIANCRSGSMKVNPRYMSDDDVRALLGTLSQL